MAKEISNDWLSIEEAVALIRSGEQIELSESSAQQIAKCREYLDQEIDGNTTPVYGINTGFGSLCNTSIPNESLEQLQVNLVRSHACGMGETVPENIVKIMLFLKAKGLSYGHSGVAVSTVEQLLYFYNNDILPEIFQQGSLGASGDLAPLAHMSMSLIGEGKVNHEGSLKEAADVLNLKGRSAVKLRSKEGLALLNGTQFMSSYGVHLVNRSRELLEWADLIGCVSLEAFDGRKNPFYPQIHDVRGHAGQKAVAANLLSILEGSELIDREKVNVQDPYSFRCMPQVHGASRDAVEHAATVVEREINSVTDNPTIFPDEDMIVSAGNFHGQPLALVLDFLAIAMAEIGSISERRTYKLISGTRDLPAFLVADPGLNSGFMIPQYTAASIVSQNKQLCAPASVDTIDSSNGQEDHVSMGANAATKAYRVVENVEKILAIELLNASQAIEFRRPGKSSARIESLLNRFRATVPFVERDRWFHEDMQKALDFIRKESPNG